MGTALPDHCNQSYLGEPTHSFIWDSSGDVIKLPCLGNPMQTIKMQQPIKVYPQTPYAIPCISALPINQPRDIHMPPKQDRGRQPQA